MNRIANSADATISHYIKSASEDRALRKCPVDIFSKVPGSVAGRVVMGIYKEHRGTDDTLKLVEHAIYGSSRLGLNTTIVDLSDGAEDNDPVVALDYGTRQYELSDHLGNVSVVLSGTRLPNTGNTNFTADVLSANEYYPFGMIMPNRSFSSESYRYGFNGMEKDEEVKGNGNHYTTLERQLDVRLGRWLTEDPKGKEFPWQSPYCSMDNNPIGLTDRTGESTIVDKTKDGKYKVKDGNKDDGNNGIYTKNGDLIGYSATPESFYNSEEGTWMGTIDPKDQSGNDFINNDIIKDNPSVPYYMANAKGGEPYDFKRTNGTDKVIYTTPEEYYRGMPILGEKDGKPIFGSARDVGNFGAGFVSGRSGQGWHTGRLGFDALQSYQEGKLSTESTSTQYGQKLGWRVGNQMFQKYDQSRLPGSGHLRNIKISYDIITIPKTIHYIKVYSSSDSEITPGDATVQPPILVPK